MLSRRLFSAAIIVSIMIFLTWLDFYLGKPEVLGQPGLVMALLCMAVSVIAAGELVSMWKAEDLRLRASVGCFASLIMTTFCVVPLFFEFPVDCPIGTFGWPVIGMTCAVGTAFAYEMWFSELDRQAVTRVAFYVLGLGYLLILFGFLAPHRLLERNNLLGIFTIVSLITTVKLSDAFAYFIGKSFGTKKLAPKLSPGKTIQGGLGAILGGVLGAMLMMYVIAPYLFQLEVGKPFWWVVIYGVALTVAGMFGDLAESFLKRTAQTKDSSSWFPGLGGVLDVIDSLIAAAPVSFVMWMIETSATTAS
jgi:phosphatidate cytidylyltransferase